MLLSLNLQIVSDKRSPDTEHRTCDKAGFRDLENHATVNDPNISLLSQSGNTVYESICKRLKENDGCVGKCMKAAFEYHGNQSCVEKVNLTYCELYGFF